MQKILWLSGIFLLPLLLSCKKQEAVHPDKNEQPTFLSFSASVKKGNVQLQFTVSHETNVNHYEIFSGTDGHQLCIISRLSATYVNTSKHTYTYKDSHPKGDPIYYMIGYVAKDSTLKFNSELLKVQLSNNVY